MLTTATGLPWFGFADQHTGRVSTYGGGPDVVIRAVSIGGAAVEVEKIGMKLDDGSIRWFDGGGVLPAVLKPPGHIDLRADRASLKGEFGDRRVERFVAVGTDGHQFENKVPKEWRVPDGWPA